MKLIHVVLFLFIYHIGNSQTENKKHRLLTDRFLFSAGLFSPFKQVQIGADGSLETGITEDIDFDETFKLDGIQNTFTFNFMWRFSKYWSVSTDYFKISSENNAVLKEDISWDDLVFKAGSEIKGGFGLSLYKVFVGRIISSGDKHELGGGLGVHALNVSAFIEGLAIINEGNEHFKESKVSVVLPLPNLGFWYFYTPNEKWILTARLEWFGIKIGDYSGGLWNINPGIGYQFFDNLGLSVNYKYLKISADVDKESWNGDFHMLFQGPSFTITGNF